MKKVLANILSFRNIINGGCLTVSLALAIAVVFLSLFFAISKNTNEPTYAFNSATYTPDLLAYVSEENNLILYNPNNRTKTALVNEDIQGLDAFKISHDERIAFTRQGENDTGLYVFNPATSHIAPININQNPSVKAYPLAWSPDGRYLAFEAYQDTDNRLLYVWNGKETISIMPDNALDTASRFYVAWSYDGRLAVTIQHGWSNLDIPSEIYVWDGNTTTNLSQNPEGSDGDASWSRDGQLVFQSERGDVSGIYVWDGDGYPNTSTFISIVPKFPPSFPTWADNGFLGFTMHTDSSTEHTKQVVLWDMEAKEIIKQFPIASDNGWSWLSPNGQMIFSSHLASGQPSYYFDVENTEGQILFSTVVGELSWSSDGYLAYCKFYKEIGWVLRLWDGEKTWDVARTSYKPVQWKNGGNTFSCNSG